MLICESESLKPSTLDEKYDHSVRESSLHYKEKKVTETVTETIWEANV